MVGEARRPLRWAASPIRRKLGHADSFAPLSAQTACDARRSVTRWVMGTIGALLADLREVATKERTEGTTRRRPGDAARAAIAALLLVPLVLHAHHPTATEEAVVRLYDVDPHRRPHAVPHPLRPGCTVGGRAARRHRAAAPPVAPRARPRRRGGRSLGARAADGLPGTQPGALGRLPRDLRPHRRSALPHGAPLGGGGDGAGGVTAPGPTDAPTRRRPRAAPRGVEPLPVAGLPDRSGRGADPRMGCRPRGRVGVRYARRPARAQPGRGRADQARHTDGEAAPHE